MKTILPSLAALMAAVSITHADVQVVFEHLITNESVPLPILKAQTDGKPADDRFDGSSPFDTYGGLERYDGDRLLLAVRENGVNETEADHDAALAAQFPDRSLIWINETTGAPMGVALVIGLNPVPLDEDFTGAGGTLNDYYFTFTVDEAGVIYVNYKNKLLRYAPDGNGGFEDPTVIYTHENDGSERWHQWRFETLRASGSGADTVLIAGGKTWRPSQGYREMVTEDGLTFTEKDIAGFKGGGSSIITAPFGDTPTQEWIYGSLYPGGSNGVDTRIVRYVRDAALEETFSTTSFDIQLDEEIGYNGLFVSDTEVHPNFPYLVSFSTPSWNSIERAVDPPTPGWIAIHDQFYDSELVDPDTGEGKAQLIGLHKLNVLESDELLVEPTDEFEDSALFHGTMGRVNINVLPGMRPGQAEVLWHSGIYGYGRYILDFAPKQVEVTSIERVSAEEASLSWTSEVGNFYTIESSTSLESGSWQTVADSIAGAEGGVTSATFPVAADAAEMFVRIGPGSVYSEDFESGAEGWVQGTSTDPFPDSGETLWELGTPSNVGPEMANSGSNVYGTEIDANYNTIGNLTLTSPVIDLTNVERGFLKLWHFYETSDIEGGQIQALNEAGDTVLATTEAYAGVSDGWQELSISLLRFGEEQLSLVGQKVRFQFRFLSDDVSADDGAGWYIDDLLIE